MYDLLYRDLMTKRSAPFLDGWLKFNGENGFKILCIHSNPFLKNKELKMFINIYYVSIGAYAR